MRLGFFTACLPRRELADIAAWAAGAGFDALEVAAWPRTGSRDFEASHLDVAHWDEQQTHETTQLFERHGLTLSSIGYYENNLHPDPARRRAVNGHLRHCIDAAAVLGVPTVGTFVGRDGTRPIKDNLAEAERALPPLVEYAGERGVRLVIENCPMEGWSPDGYPSNLAYSPELWEWMFGLGLYLNYDPSHLVWLGIDPVTALGPHTSRVLHMQAKDIEVDEHARNRYGIFGRSVTRRDGWDVGWWRYRVPGLGTVDWAGVISTLRDAGYHGTVSIEHEDPVYGGTEDKVRNGLLIGAQTLRPLLDAAAPAADPAIATAGHS